MHKFAFVAIAIGLAIFILRKWTTPCLKAKWLRKSALQLMSAVRYDF
jgi:hypothetical protein